MLDLKMNVDGLPCYKALWSDYHCHNGLSASHILRPICRVCPCLTTPSLLLCSGRFGGLVTPDWYRMEHAENDENGTPPPVDYKTGCPQS